VVLFASDGILEAESPEQEEFGLERLTALLATAEKDASAQSIAERVLEATCRHCGPDQCPHDDRTLVVLRVTEETASDLSKMPIIY
jgi:serine phosphatase RsbU (regulator of sigma subunit)